MTLRINNIYSAFMGECNVHGIGVPCTFVRLAGCNLRCYFKTKGCLCDTPEALSDTSGKLITVEQIAQRVCTYGNKVVCLTGGEPLLQDVTELLIELTRRGFSVVVETNGSVDISPYRHIRNVSFVVDVKSQGSGENKKMLTENYCLLDKNDFVKFVIDTDFDYREFELWMDTHGYNLDCNVAVGVFWGSEIDYQWLIKKLISDNFSTRVYLNMQTHKMACLYDFYHSDKQFSELTIPKSL